MKTDRELLELAAKAHGGIPARCVGAPSALYCCDEPGKPSTHPQWNPLADDGDALRLAVKLAVRVEPMAAWCVTYAGSVCAKQFSERVKDDDRAAATRRAIVRAAAAIGEQT